MKHKRRIVLDARWLNRTMHGIARYTSELINNMPLSTGADLLILYNRKDFDPISRSGLIWLDVNIPLFSKQEYLLSGLISDLKPDLLHVPSYWMPYQAQCPWVMTVHDLIHLLPPVSIKYQVYYRYLKHKLKKSSGVLTVSEASANRIAQCLNPPDIKVTHLGVADIYRNAEAPFTQAAVSSKTASYFFYIGNPKPHKQFALIVQAYRWFRKNHPDIALYTLGVKESQIEGHIALGFCPESKLPALYSGALALLVPSLEEGFGLPAIEAMACGTPVLASDIPVHREILGVAAQYIQPENARAWAESMADLLLKPLSYEVATVPLKKQANKYCWSKMARETYDYYLEALNR